MIRKIFRAVWRYGRWVVLLLVLGFIGLVIARIPVVMQKKDSAKAVEAIHAQHITLTDVDGSNLPPQPSAEEVNATVAGVDVNVNGIRDDVELALFEKYPDNIQLRAAALQYAMAEQQMLTMVTNQETWVASAQMMSQGTACTFSIFNGTPKKAIAELGYWQNLIVNTPGRVRSRDDAYKFTTSYADLNSEICDFVGTAGH